MFSVLTWAVAHQEALLGIAAAAHALAVGVVNLTPTPKDDNAVAKVYRVVEVVAGLVTSKAKN